MNLNHKNDNEIMRALNVSELRHHFAETNKGNLTAMIRFGDTKYSFVLDAVPVEEEVNKQLHKLYGIE
jgi:hypothetical protein